MDFILAPVAPVAPVIVKIDASGIPASAAPTSTFPLAASATAMDGWSVYHVRWSSDTNLDDGEVSVGTLLDNSVEGNHGTDPAKVNWNYGLLHSDGSAGVHNPSRVNAIIVNTQKVITAGWPDES